MGSSGHSGSQHLLNQPHIRIATPWPRAVAGPTYGNVLDLIGLEVSIFKMAETNKQQYILGSTEGDEVLANQVIEGPVTLTPGWRLKSTRKGPKFIL
jgi:hypothetical protein